MEQASVSNWFWLGYPTPDSVEIHLGGILSELKKDLVRITYSSDVSGKTSLLGSVERALFCYLAF